jgi:hypothetical protein
VERNDGAGPAIDVGSLRGNLLEVRLGINNVLEQERLAVSIWGSASGTEWSDRPLVSFPGKSYCGVYSAFLNLANYPAIRYLRVEWKMSRWANRGSTRMFGFFVSMEESVSRINAAVA